jgi:hypothetical protein
MGQSTWLGLSSRPEDQVTRPRLRGKTGEIPLKSYQKLKKPEQFSEELLTKILSGISPGDIKRQ